MSVGFQSPARECRARSIRCACSRRRERAADIDRGDGVVGGRRQAGIEVVFAQRVQDEQHEGDRNQRHRQQRRPALAGPEIDEQIDEEEDRDRVIDARRVRCATAARGSRSWRCRLHGNGGRAPSARPSDVAAGRYIVATLESHLASQTPFSRIHLARPGMDRHRLDRRFDAAPLEARHVVGDLREGRIDLGELGGVLLDDFQHLVDVRRPAHRGRRRSRSRTAARSPCRRARCG